MSEPIQTGHRVYFGNRKLNMEMLEAKPYYVATPGSELSQEELEAEEMKRVKKPVSPPPPPVAEAAPEPGSPEDIAARIAGDRTKNQADILELAKSQVDS